MTQRLVEIAATAQRVGHGNMDAVYASACTELGISRSTLMRALHTVSVRPPRKRRSDAGQVWLTREEAVIISALLMESHRKTGKRLLSIGQAVEILRANPAEGVRAERVDPETGECFRLSDSAIARALRHYCLHPDQLLRPSTAVELRSLHPNHVWQIDASLCVLYYLNARSKRESGLQVMEHDKFYKNKPANLKRIENDRVWSYEITDHNSGAIYVHYVLGAESGANIAEAFMAAIQQRDDEPFYGVPYGVMMDPGSANTGGMFTNLLRRLDVKPIVHAPGAARVTGQVEKARDIIERSFEPALKLQAVGDLDELNAQARRWARWYNEHKIHSRHGRTRFEQWMTITPEQLRVAPSAERCRELLTHGPVKRKVNLHSRIEFKGREYDVSAVPRVMIGESLQVTYNPYRPDEVLIVDTDVDGLEILIPVPLVELDDAGFAKSGNVIGEDWKRPADTIADRNRKEVELVAMDAPTLEAAAAARKAKQLPFGGRIDAMRVVDQATQQTFLPRRGTDLPVSTTVGTAAPTIFSHFQAASELARRGVQMSAELNATLRSLYPDGVPEPDLDELQTRLTVRAGLRVVAGGS
ncbi:TPA: DDE-type integrase/transposase/recombinase [Burkholderia stabilis]|nr:DDE-type integrase/transposase/recombinase [Burkholderia stabilis]HDR9589137.1 DDE-type integrase/transposase/recombinase [Burkholderia stabilis]HDR9649533.1 DDE-type integrase/transposase/recombinase [Burkholderia stabilis]HDR9653599.1 DDE-type integrase/transposase/recombinase [Burkholderia stabilis]HDR9656294.1 DDE-type integrase/transposase/recombinase [Burkholderia stabilis]